MKNFWTILIVILALIVGFRLLGIFFSVGFMLLRAIIPIAFIFFAIYGFLAFLKKR
ncbi:MAG: hypothetical protein KAX49_09060 [Halanaerobiales bacterium]|nr:hypothetical protein [Halanaerobiales bacterium]